MCRSFRILGLIALFGSLNAPLALAEVKQPKPPDKFNVEFRYRIKADRNERIRQFDVMTKYLGGLGFVENESEDSDLAPFDPTQERMSGTIPSKGARSILLQPSIHTVLLTPSDWKAPADDKERVKVLLELSSGFGGERQRLYADQIKQVLGKFGFLEAIAYDHRGYSVLRGTMPWVYVRTLLKDLRTQPGGWFLPITHEDDLPEPFKLMLPIRLIEVQPEKDAPPAVVGQAALPLAPADQQYLNKIAGELRRHATENKDAPVRVEILLVYTPSVADDSWKQQIRNVSGASIDGRLGNVVTALLPAGDRVNRVAALSGVASVRLPRIASIQVPQAPKEEPKKEDLKEKTDSGKIILAHLPKAERDLFANRLMLQQGATEFPIRRPLESPIRLANAESPSPFDPLKESKLDQLHARGKRGAGTRVAIFDTDFTGWEKYVGRGLPKSTHHVDLTAERNSEIDPEPIPPNTGIGHGTHCALAVRLAAPEADIALVRVAADAPYQILAAYRYMLGDMQQPISFVTRREEIDLEAATVRTERLTVNAQYRKAFDNFDDDEEARQARRAAKTAVAEVEKKEKLLTARINRLLKLELDLIALRGCNVILNTLGWNQGMPLDGTSYLSRTIDSTMAVSRPPIVKNGIRQPRPPIWFQPASDTRGQSYIGVLRDVDGNGLMEWGTPADLLRPERWTAEMNFLAFRPNGGPDSPDLPDKARVRITIQWREPHDNRVAEDDYREPIVYLGLMLLRQRDPNADKLPADEMELMARSEGSPERLHSDPNFGIYEQSIEMTLPASGRYTLMVPGSKPIGIRPGGSIGVNEQDLQWDLRPRIFIQVLDDATRAKGRIVFGDYQTFLGGVAVPADGHNVIAVGAMQPSRKPQPFSAIGAGMAADLFVKPDVMTYDQLPRLGDGTGPARGSTLSAAFATGMGASLLSAGAPSASFMEKLRIQPGHIFEVPEGWLRR